jgi:hypothetical protein
VRAADPRAHDRVLENVCQQVASDLFQDISQASFAQRQTEKGQHESIGHHHSLHKGVKANVVMCLQMGIGLTTIVMIQAVLSVMSVVRKASVLYTSAVTVSHSVAGLTHSVAEFTHTAANSFPTSRIDIDSGEVHRSSHVPNARHTLTKKL